MATTKPDKTLWAELVSSNFANVSQSATDAYNASSMVKITIILIIAGLIAIFAWIGHQASLYDKACTTLDTIYGNNKTNNTYFNSATNIRAEASDNFNNPTVSKLINYHVKSAYNCCCGDGYKNNFVNLCALKKVIANGCRFLDFEIYSYNNDPIIASSTLENNFIKETYNALLLSDVLTTITLDAFDGEMTNCAKDPLILNFRVKSTNLTMLVKMGDLLEEYLDRSINADFTLLKNLAPGAVLQFEMKNLYKRIIIICTFFPTSNILLDSRLTKLNKLITMIGGSDYCRTYRYTDITDPSSPTFSAETMTKYIIVLPDRDTSTTNFDAANYWIAGCQAICMKHQTNDSNLQFYNQRFDTDNNKNFSWNLKGTAR